METTTKTAAEQAAETKAAANAAAEKTAGAVENKPAQPAQPDAAAITAARAGATKAERERIGAILTSEEAKGREALARVLALETDNTPEQARKLLAAAPVAGANADHLAKAMAAIGNPKVGVSEAASGEASEASEEVKRIVAVHKSLRGK